MRKRIMAFVLTFIYCISCLSGVIYAAGLKEYYASDEEFFTDIEKYEQGKSSNKRGLSANRWTWNNYNILAYGDIDSVKAPDNLPPQTSKLVDGKYEYRYLGYDYFGEVISNQKFPNDDDSSTISGWEQIRDRMVSKAGNSQTWRINNSDDDYSWSIGQLTGFGIPSGWTAERFSGGDNSKVHLVKAATELSRGVLRVYLSNGNYASFDILAKQENPTNPEPKPQTKKGYIHILYYDKDSKTQIASREKEEVTITKGKTEEVTIQSKNINGYKYYGFTKNKNGITDFSTIDCNSTAKINLTYTESEVYVLFLYTKENPGDNPGEQGEGRLIIKYEDINGATLKPQVIETLPYGTYTRNAVKIGGYTPVGDVTKTVKIDKFHVEVRIVFTYEKEQPPPPASVDARMVFNQISAEKDEYSYNKNNVEGVVNVPVSVNSFVDIGDNNGLSMEYHPKYPDRVSGYPIAGHLTGVLKYEIKSSGIKYQLSYSSFKGNFHMEKYSTFQYFTNILFPCNKGYIDIPIPIKYLSSSGEDVVRIYGYSETIDQKNDFYEATSYVDVKLKVKEPQYYNFGVNLKIKNTRGDEINKAFVDEDVVLEGSANAYVDEDDKLYLADFTENEINSFWNIDPSGKTNCHIYNPSGRKLINGYESVGNRKTHTVKFTEPGRYYVDYDACLKTNENHRGTQKQYIDIIEKPKMGKIIVKYIDKETNKQIIDDDIYEDILVGKEKRCEAKDLIDKGYKLIGEKIQRVIVKEGENIVAFYYKKLGDFVPPKAVLNLSNSSSGPFVKEITIKQGEPMWLSFEGSKPSSLAYCIESYNICGFVYMDDEKIKYDKTNVIVSMNLSYAMKPGKYKIGMYVIDDRGYESEVDWACLNILPIEGTLITRFVEYEGGRDIQPQRQEKLVYGTYTRTAPEIKGYIAIGRTERIVNIDREEVRITFDYIKDLSQPSEGKLITKYVDKKGNSIKQQTEENLVYGTYTRTAPRIDNYILTGETTKTVTINEKNPEVTITFTYNKDSIELLSADYDIDTIKALDFKTHLEVKKLPYKVDVNTYDKYEYVGALIFPRDLAVASLESNEEVRKLLREGGIENLANYMRNKSKNKGLGDVKIRTTYSKEVFLTQQDVNNKYQDYSIIKFYKKDEDKGKLTTKFVDEKGNSIRPQIEENLKFGTYTRIAPNIESYMPIGVTTKTATLDKEHLEAKITFVYNKIPNKPPIVNPPSQGRIVFNPNSTDWTNEGKTSNGFGNYSVNVSYDGLTTMTGQGIGCFSKKQDGKEYEIPFKFDVFWTLQSINVLGSITENVSGNGGNICITRQSANLYLYGEGVWSNPQYTLPTPVADETINMSKLELPNNPSNPTGSSGVYKLDWENPYIGISEPSSKWVNIPQNVSVNVLDNLSGIASASVDVKDSSHFRRNTSSNFSKNTVIKLYDGIYTVNASAEDIAGNVGTNSKGKYYVDTTKPDVDFSIKSEVFGEENGAIKLEDGLYGDITLSDNLSGIYSAEYCWTFNNSDSVGNYTELESRGGKDYKCLSGVYNMYKYTYNDRGTEKAKFRIRKPVGDYMYLHIKTYDVAGNYTYKSFGPYIDPLKVTATLSPNPAMRGQKVTFNISTIGYPKYLTIDFPIEISSLDAVEVFKFRDMVITEEEKHNELVYYWLPLDTPVTLDKDNNRLREPYIFTITAQKENGRRKRCQVSLDVKGSILDGIKTEIKIN